MNSNSQRERERSVEDQLDKTWIKTLRTIPLHERLSSSKSEQRSNAVDTG